MSKREAWRGMATSQVRHRPESVVRRCLSREPYVGSRRVRRRSDGVTFRQNDKPDGSMDAFARAGGLRQK